MSNLPTPIQYSPGIPSQSIRQKEEIKDKEIVKVSLFADDMILYLKVSKNSTQKPLDTINSFSNVAEYKLNL
jgi:hypothetical protein